MRIIVAGAGIGGLSAAALLGKGAEVTVYERAKSLNAMRYPWHDDVTPGAFADAGLGLPKDSFIKKDWSFVTPDGKGIRRMHEEESRADYSVWRPALNGKLVENAERCCSVVFGEQVTALLTSNGTVTGAVVNGREEKADLVIDSTGVDSPLKRSVKEITRHSSDEIFVVYRAFYEKNFDAPEAEHSNKAYLKHIGENGIAWAIQDEDKVDVLVGRLGEMSDETLKRALSVLKQENPTIGEKTVMGGGIYRIPVRYPATRMVLDGYAAIGDAAYMTIPMLGSGIASSMAAAKMLSDVVIKALNAGMSASEAASAENLFEYQRRFFTEIGANHCGVDVMKRGVLSFSDDMLGWLLTSSVLTNADVCRLAKGTPIYIGFGDALKKVAAAGICKIPALLKVNSMLMRSHRAIRVARRIPESYSAEAIARWEKKLRRIIAGE